jgi:hypothetical protein
VSCRPHWQWLPLRRSNYNRSVRNQQRPGTLLTFRGRLGTPHQAAQR